MVSAEEIQKVLKDLRWLDECTCGVLPLSAFFLKPGHTISAETLKVARACPVRRQEIIYAYGRSLSVGYYGGLSGGQRSSMTLDEALEFIANEPELVFKS